MFNPSEPTEDFYKFLPIKLFQVAVYPDLCIRIRLELILLNVEIIRL